MKVYQLKRRNILSSKYHMYTLRPVPNTYCVNTNAMPGQASFYLLEPAVNTVLCRLCYKQMQCLIIDYSPMTTFVQLRYSRHVLLSKF